MPSFTLDGNWVDIATFLLAAVFVAFKYLKLRNTSKRFFSKSTGYDLMTGTSIFPLFMLGGSAFSSGLLNSLLSSNKLLMSVAGFFALFAMLEDEFEKEPEPQPKRSNKRQQPTNKNRQTTP